MSAKDSPNHVRLNAQTMALLWAVFICVIGALIYQVRRDTRLELLIQQVNENQTVLFGHINVDGHPVALQMTKDVLRRVETLEKKP